MPQYQKENWPSPDLSLVSIGASSEVAGLLHRAEVCVCARARKFRHLRFIYSNMYALEQVSGSLNKGSPCQWGEIVDLNQGNLEGTGRGQQSVAVLKCRVWDFYVKCWQLSPFIFFLKKCHL